MKLNFAERMLVNNPVRGLVQRWYEAPLLRRLGGRLDGAQVLDVGCGQGIGMEVILRHFGAARVCGLDLDPAQVARAQRRLQRRYAGRFELAAGSVDRLTFADASFDAVFDFGMLHHVPDWQGGVREIRRVLKPGGTLFFEEVTRQALERWWYRTFLEHPAENRFSEDEFLAELDRQGMLPFGKVHPAWAGDIFIGVARRMPEL